MGRYSLMFVFSAFCFFFCLCTKSLAESSVVIRDIQGPLPPSGLPPFAATAALTLLCGAAVWMFRRKAEIPAVIPTVEIETDSLSAQLATLEDRYRKGEINSSLLFDSLTHLLRTHLSDMTGADPLHFTSEELLSRAERHLSADSFSRATGLLCECDAVRFGAVPPDDAAIDRAFRDSENLINFHCGTAP